MLSENWITESAILTELIKLLGFEPVSLLNKKGGCLV